MFKKKPIYIIGIILFTLILIADLVLYFFIPTGFGRGNMGDFGGGKPGGGFASGDSGFDSLEGSGAGGDGISSFEDFAGGGFQNEGDFEAMPPNWENGDFTMPEGMEPPEGMTPPNGMAMPGGFDPSRKPGSVMTILTGIRSAFWPVLIGCILGDGLCSFMLIRIRRTKKAAAVLTASDTSAEQRSAMGKDD